MPKVLHVCTVDGCATLIDHGTRCAQHQQAMEWGRPKRLTPQQAGYDAEYRRNRKILLDYQPWCALCGTEGSPDNPLTADHIVDLVNGGGNGLDNLRIACRSCNSRQSRQRTQVWVGPLDPSYADHPRDISQRAQSRVLHLIGAAATGKSTVRDWLLITFDLPSFGIDDERERLRRPGQTRIPDDLPAWLNLEHQIDTHSPCAVETSGRNGNDRVLLYQRQTFTLLCVAEDAVRRERLTERVQQGDHKTQAYHDYIDRLLNQRVPQRRVDFTWDTTDGGKLDYEELRARIGVWLSSHDV